MFVGRDDSRLNWGWCCGISVCGAGAIVSTLAWLFVVYIGLRAQFRRFFFGRGVTQKISPAYLGTCEIFQQIRLAQRGMKLDVKVKRAVVATIGRRLMKRHDVRERHAPQIIELYEQMFQCCSEVAHLKFRQTSEARMRFLRRDESFVCVASEVGQKNDGVFILEYNATSIFALGLDDVLEKNSSCATQVLLRSSRFGFDCLEYEVSGVYLAMRMWIGYTYYLAFVLEDQNVRNLIPSAEFNILLLPDSQQILDLAPFEFGKRHVVLWAVTHNTRDASRRSIAVETIGLCQTKGRIESHARMIVIEDERARIQIIVLTTYARVAGTKIAIRCEIR